MVNECYAGARFSYHTSMTTPLTATSIVESLLAATDLEIRDLEDERRRSGRLSASRDVYLIILQDSKRPTLVGLLAAFKDAGIA